MAQEQQLSSITAPAQLFIGPSDALMRTVEQHLQSFFCKNNACTICFACEQIRKHQHHALLWLAPEKRYTLESLDIIFETAALALNQEEHFFFILEKADLLTPASSNKLLKILEEPPTGYHFILCAERSDTLLPTIRSRCITKSLYGEEDKQIHTSLAHFFTIATTTNPNEFLKTLDTSKINEQESAELLDYIINFWTKKYKAALIHNALEEQQHADKKITLFTKALHRLPMPGSSKIFWKNLFLLNDA